MFKSKTQYYLAIAIMYVITFGIAIHTPLHSDDYAYSLKGIAITSHINHYFTWSGRIVADYVSGLLLFIDSHYVRAAINATAPVILSVLINKVGASLTLKKSGSSEIIVTSIIFLIYWTANTNIGQTTFWLVGSANYLWTNILICTFLMMVIRAYKQQSEKLSIITLLLSILAGCSNENTGFVAIAFPFICYTYHLYFHKRKIMPMIYYFAGAIVGYALLVLSPGNGARAKYFSYWYDMPITDRLLDHYYHRAVEMMGMLWLPLLVITISLFISGILGKSNKNNNALIISAAFLVAALTSVAMMIAAPGYPPRSGNGTLVLMLISLSVLIHHSIKEISSKWMYAIISLLLIIYFIPSYYFMYKSYKSVFEQNTIRMNIIKSMTSSGSKDFKIPDFYFPKILSQSQKFDMYHSPKTYGDFFGVDKITKSNSTFDYSSLLSASEYKVDKVLIPDSNTILESVIITKKNNMIVLKTNKGMSSKSFTDGPKIYLHVFYKGQDKFKNFDFWPSSTVLTNYSWTAKDIDAGEINKIEIGTYNLSGPLSQIFVGIE
jgi:hypothetical protein